MLKREIFKNRKKLFLNKTSDRGICWGGGGSAQKQIQNI